MKKIILAFPLLAFFSGCAVQTHYYQTGVTEPTGKVAPADVKVYSGRAPTGTSFLVLGSVAVDVPGDGSAVLPLLKEEAAKMGADAVIEVKLTKINSFAERTGLSGTAIRTTAK
jgi:hypothetical protein